MSTQGKSVFRLDIVNALFIPSDQYSLSAGAISKLTDTLIVGRTEIARAEFSDRHSTLLFKTNPEFIQFAVMLYSRYSLSLPARTASLNLL